MFARSLSSSILVAAMTTVLAAQAPALDVKLGLWETTVVTDMGGGAPPLDTSKMPPEQAAKIAAAMKGMMGPQTIVEKSCLTKEDLEKDSFMMPENSRMKCTRTITSNTKATFDAEFKCTGETEMTGQMRAESLAGGNAYKSTMKMTGITRGRPMNMTMTMTGKYLGPECGNVK